MQRPPIGLRQNGAGRIVWGVDEDECSPRVGELHHLLDVDRELIFWPKVVVPHFEAE